MKNCTPLWREAHFEVKMYKTHHSRTTFGSWDVEKSTPLWREEHLQAKKQKHPTFVPVLEVEIHHQTMATAGCTPASKHYSNKQTNSAKGGGDLVLLGFCLPHKWTFQWPCSPVRSVLKPGWSLRSAAWHWRPSPVWRCASLHHVAHGFDSPNNGACASSNPVVEPFYFDFGGFLSFSSSFHFCSWVCVPFLLPVSGLLFGLPLAV